MPILLKKHEIAQRSLLRDVRPASVRIAEFWGTTNMVGMVLIGTIGAMFLLQGWDAYFDLILLIAVMYFRWVFKRAFTLPFKFPAFAKRADPNNPPPGKSGPGKAEGIMFIGNINDGDNPEHKMELWLTNNDCRTHILFLGTTGSGKTEGLKSLVANSLTWGSGFVYVDGKADTDLWASLYALARRFGRDDDLLVLNYMTANSDDGATSNTMNPFSTGSASYLSNMVTSLMPDAGGDNAMWKERAVALLSALMPALTWKRDKQGLLLDVGVVREYIELRPIVALSRDPNLPERIVRGLQGYLNTLPGYVDAAFDDEGNERPPSPDQPMYDLQVARQQHGYLSMQFTRSLQSLADEYGYIFKVQLADIDVLDVVLNRRILVALIPALEKSGDEAANLGKIIAASLKGMMGATLGNTVEGSWETAIGSKQTRSASSFMTIFDEVGYYTAQGMAVMAAQARSLGFSLVFAAQDLPAMEKRVKQEAQSILGNCNLKIFGKIEDPTETKDFLAKHAGDSWVLETRGMSAPTNTVASTFLSSPFYDDRGTGGVLYRSRVTYDHLRGQREGETHMFFGDWAVKTRMFYAVPEKVQALRVHRLLPVPGTTTATAARERIMADMTSRLKDDNWSAEKALPPVPTLPEIRVLSDAFAGEGKNGLEDGIFALTQLATLPVSAQPPARVVEEPDPLAEPVAQPKNAPRAAAAQQSGGNGAAKAASNGKTAAQQAVASPYDSDPSLDQAGQLRAGLPALQEGDQYVIDEIEHFFSDSHVMADDPSPVGAPPEGKAHHDMLKTGYVPKESDFGVVTPYGFDEEDMDVLKTELPAEIAATLQESATRLNEGMKGNAV